MAVMFRGRPSWTTGDTDYKNLGVTWSPWFSLQWFESGILVKSFSKIKKNKCSIFCYAMSVCKLPVGEWLMSYDFPFVLHH